ncbi:uncharacterized protein K02A2.6-like [Lucilia cuprina]|uniref:uncharacterized protein K02A2.6-like n=1 Tax=Lucilia cuprina TaxID=7375 RepID=UPI001F06B428|nr:uncharacterized protein K02A2.6-like [Lucilia cuprina]
MPDNVPGGTVTIYHPNNMPQFSPRNESWLLWKEKLDIHFTEINCTEESTKKATLLKAIGPIATLQLTKMHYTPPTIIFRERKSFHTAIQGEDETVAEWHARVKKLALACKFGVHLDAFVLDRFIMGINNKIFERLCEEDEKITIEDALRKALIMEMNINNCGNSTELYKVSIKIDGIPIEVVCDSGAPCSLVSKSFVDSLNKKVSLKSCTDPYVDFNGNKIKVLGQYDEIIELKGTKKTVKLVVTDSNNNPLFGRNFLRTFNFELIQVNSVSSDQYSIITEQIKNEFHEIFSSGLGSYKFGKISLAINSEATPIFCKPRPVPLAWKGKIENNLRELIANDVLEQVDHSEWGTPLVPILKPNGDIRICGDYKVTINKYLSDFNYPLPLIDEIFASLQGGQLFSKLDLSNAYNQLILDDKSQLLCTWSTHIGTLKMKRLPFGVKPAAAIFQKTMENLLQGIPFVVVYQDDITVSVKDMNEHIRNLKVGVKDVSNDFIPPELPSSSNGSTSTEKVERSHNDNNSSEVNNNEHEPN